MLYVLENIISKDCENFKINDCATANKELYCYCTIDLCNGFNKKSSITVPSDDEDLVEGSGTNERIENSSDGTRILTTLSSLNSANQINSIFALPLCLAFVI